MARLYLGDTVETDDGVGTITFITQTELTGIDRYAITDSEGVTKYYYRSEIYTQLD